MTSLVDGNGTLLALGHHLRLLLQTADDTVNGIEEVLLLHSLRVMTGSYQGSLVTDIGDISTREARCLTGQEVDVHAVVGLHRLQMHLEHLLTLVEVRQVYMDLTVEAPCTQQRRVEHVGTVCGSQDYHTRVRAKTVHLRQQGIERILALIVATHGWILRAGTAHGVNLIYKYNTR